MAICYSAGFLLNENMDPLAVTIPHEIPPFMKGRHCMLSLQEALRLQSPAELIQVRCGCKGHCNTIRCKCFKATVECTLHCLGQNDEVQCTNNGVLAAPSATFNLKRKTTARPSHNSKRLQANTPGEATAQSYSTCIDNVNQCAEENVDSDLTEQDIEEGQRLEEFNDVDEDEEEEKEEDKEEHEQEDDDVEEEDK